MSAGRFTILLALSALLSLPLPGTSLARATPGSAVIRDQYIVTFKDTVGDAEGLARALAAQHGLRLHYIYRHALKGFAARIPVPALARLQANPHVASVVADTIVSLAAQTVPTGVDRLDAETSPTAKINGVDERVDVDIAVIDTGIDRSHPDLHVVGGINCLLGTPLGLLGYNDDHGHGSHVAGTIAAKDTNAGVVGVAPGARLWAVKVLNALGSGSASAVICGIDWVAGHREIEVANMSLGGRGSDDGKCGTTNNDALHRAICSAVANQGVTFVVAAGNDAQDAMHTVPAAYDEVITVSALADFNGQPGGGAAPTCRPDVDDTFADFSNGGADVDLIAPGVCIRSTWMGGGYATLSGTSMAAPHVAGAAALYKAKHPSASPAAVKSALQSAATLNWTTNTDPDGQPDRLVNVASF
jgi:subtilisin